MLNLYIVVILHGHNHFFVQVDSAWTSGRYEEARRHSNNARILNYIGIGVGIGVWVIVGIGVVIRIVLSFAFL